MSRLLFSSIIFFFLNFECWSDSVPGANVDDDVVSARELIVVVVVRRQNILAS